MRLYVVSVTVSTEMTNEHHRQTVHSVVKRTTAQLPSELFDEKQGVIFCIPCLRLIGLVTEDSGHTDRQNTEQFSLVHKNNVRKIT